MSAPKIKRRSYSLDSGRKAASILLLNETLVQFLKVVVVKVSRKGFSRRCAMRTFARIMVVMCLFGALALAAYASPAEETAATGQFTYKQVVELRRAGSHQGAGGFRPSQVREGEGADNRLHAARNRVQLLHRHRGRYQGNRERHGGLCLHAGSAERRGHQRTDGNDPGRDHP